jgi:ribosomal protein L11
MRDLIDALLIAAGDSTAEELAEALHTIVISQSDVCQAFNRRTDRHAAAERRKLVSAPLHKLMTKHNFGSN